MEARVSITEQEDTRDPSPRNYGVKIRPYLVYFPYLDGKPVASLSHYFGYKTYIQPNLMMTDNIVYVCLYMYVLFFKKWKYSRGWCGSVD